MTHIQYDRGDYDASTKTLYKSTPLAPINRGPDAWEVDPQQQIIDLLKEQLILLRKIADSSVPYHTGPQAVSLLPVSAPGDQKGPITPVDATKP